MNRTFCRTLPGLVFAALATSACSSATGPDGNRQVDSLAALPRAISITEQRGIEAGNAFALRLLRDVSARSTKNVLLSPFSVWTALGLTMNGAGGNTEAEMRSTLGWSTPTRAELNAGYRDLAALLPTLDPSVTFKSANGIWTRQPLVDFDEVGARAAAVTSVTVIPTSELGVYTMTKPFVFFIRERFTGAVLFVGVVRDPRS